MTDQLQPDPSLIGGVPKAPFALLPEPVKLFQERAKRLAFLAESSDLAPYLSFLAEIARLQARLSVTLPPIEPIAARRQKDIADVAMPPIDRAALAKDAALATTFAAFIEGAAGIDMPQPARLALDAVRDASVDDRAWLLANVLADVIPEGSAAPHLFAAGAVQVHATRLAAALDVELLGPVGIGTCPSCGGRPATSSVLGEQGKENARYAFCATCATQWNEVRVKCLCCGSTKGISYRSAETHEATVKAEVCKQCHSWVKILYRVKNASLDPIADDIGSLGLDILMKETEFRRGAFNPFLVGY